MNVVTTPSVGFCFGVERAVNAAFALIDDPALAGKKIYTYGELIHNPEINAALSARGVVIADTVEEIENGSAVIIRSHGVSEKVIETLKQKNVTIFDETCPKVKKIHKVVINAENLIIAGNIEHPEVKGIIGNCKKNFYVAKDIDELKKILHNIYMVGKQYTFVSQTTFSVAEFRRMEEYLSGYDGVRIINTICSVTEERQRQVEDLAKKSDVFIVVGGKNSSNTKKLYDIASRYCTAYHIESAKELPYNLKDKKIGLSSGASTPVRTVEEVIYNMISENDNQSVFEENSEFLEAMQSDLKTIRNGQRVKGIVSAINGSEVQVDLGVKYAGIIPADEFSAEETPKIGDEIEAFVIKVSDAEGTAQLSKRNLDIAKGFEKISDAFEKKTILTGKVAEVVKGGLIVTVNGARVFVPASQATLKKEENLEPMKNTEVKLRIIELDDSNPRRKRIIGSVRSVLRDERHQQIVDLWASLEVGKRYEGIVKSITAFGAFVDIGGIDGLVHISDMTWTRVKNPAELVTVGEKVSVIIKSFDQEKRRISLTMKDPEQNPWDILKAGYNVGDVVEVTVVKLMPYGAFVNVIPGIDGLVHISQISKERLAKVSDALSVGQKVNAMITDIDFETQKINLSVRKTEEPDEAVAGEPEEVEVLTEFSKEE